MSAQNVQPPAAFASGRRSEANDESGVLPKTWANPRDGSVLRLIPAGEFIMGSTLDDIEAARKMDQDGPLYVLRHETPQSRVFVPAYYIGMFAVTNLQFAQFLNEVAPAP